MRSLIVYGSRHHGNTEKLVRELASKFEIELIDSEAGQEVDFQPYDLIGFASGLDFGKFYTPVTALAEQLPFGKKVFSIYTCAKDQEQYGRQVEEIAKRTGCMYLGKFGCRGYNTYGPLKIVGGMNRKHPNQEDHEKLAAFYEEIIRVAEE